MDESNGPDETPETGPDPLASTQAFDTTSAFDDDDEPGEAEEVVEPTPADEPEPTAVQESVFEPPATTPDIPVAAATPPPPTPVPPAPPAGGPPVSPAGPPPGSPRKSRLPLVLGILLVVALVAAGILGFLLITADDDDTEDVVATTAAPEVDQGGGQENQGDQGNGGEAAGDEAEAQQVVVNFIGARGTDDERAFSSEGGREEFDAVIDDLGGARAQGNPQCEAQDDGTFECVLDTDEGAIVLTVGEDPDDPGGLEVIGAEQG